LHLLDRTAHGGPATVEQGTVEQRTVEQRTVDDPLGAGEPDRRAHRRGDRKHSR
jgi:hypothetical protein